MSSLLCCPPRLSRNPCGELCSCNCRLSNNQNHSAHKTFVALSHGDISIVSENAKYKIGVFLYIYTDSLYVLYVLYISVAVSAVCLWLVCFSKQTRSCWAGYRERLLTPLIAELKMMMSRSMVQAGLCRIYQWRAFSRNKQSFRWREGEAQIIAVQTLPRHQAPCQFSAVHQGRMADTDRTVMIECQVHLCDEGFHALNVYYICTLSRHFVAWVLSLSSS